MFKNGNHDSGTQAYKVDRHNMSIWLLKTPEGVKHLQEESLDMFELLRMLLPIRHVVMSLYNTSIQSPPRLQAIRGEVQELRSFNTSVLSRRT